MLLKVNVYAKLPLFYYFCKTHFSFLQMDDLNKKYYKISEVAELLNLPASTLRFWESKFTVIKPKRNDKGTRFYTPADIEKIAIINYLIKQRGLHIEAAQQQIKINPEGIRRQYDAISRLTSVKEKLQQMIKTLNSLR